MNLSSFFLNKVFSYIILVFPLFLFFGSVISELFLLLIIIFSFSLNNYSKEIISDKRYVIFFGLFYLSTLISTLINYYNFDYSKSGIFFIRIILFSLAISIILKTVQLKTKKVLIFYNIFFSIIIIDSLIQYYFGKNLLDYRLIHGRVSSFFKDELILGSFLLRTIPIFFVYILLNNQLKNKNNFFFYLILLSFISLIIYISGERTSFFLLLLFYFILFLFVKNLRKFVFYLCIVYFILILAVTFIFNSNYTNTYSRIFVKTFNQILGSSKKELQNDKRITSTINIFSTDHQSHYELSLKIIKDHFFVGTGIKGFRYLCRNKIYILDKENDGCSTHPHNTYIHIFVSNGLIGFLLIITAYLYIIFEIFNSKKKLDLKDKLSNLRVSKIVILIGLFVNFWPFAPSGNFFNNWLSIFYFYQIGLYLYFKNENKTKIS